MASRGAALLALISTAALAGCAEAPAPVAAPAPGVTSDQLVGKWGLASYHKDEDRARTMKEARSQCNKPYVITKGPTGGVMMYLADQSEPQELVLKGAAGGKTYVGPPGDAGGSDDREVIDVDANSFTTNFVDPDNAHRYGTMVYVRCPTK